MRCTTLCYYSLFVDRHDLLVSLLGDGTIQRPEVLSQGVDARRTHNGRRDELARVHPSHGHLRGGEADLYRTDKTGAFESRNTRRKAQYS